MSKKDNGWIAWLIALGLLFSSAVACSVYAPCSWYDLTPQKNVPNRCAK